MKTNKRLKTIKEIQSLVSYQNANPDHILWSKTWDYDPTSGFSAPSMVKPTPSIAKERIWAPLITGCTYAVI